MMVTAIMAEIANHATEEPWPSLDWASWIFDRASFVLVGSLVLGVAATVAIVWMGIVKEHHWDLARERAALVTAQLQAIAPRVLSVPAQNELQEKLKPFASSVIEIGTTQPLRHAFDVDSLEAQLAGVFALAGVRTSAGLTWGTDERPSGVWVSAREGEANAASAADVIVSELMESGIVAHRDPKPFAGPIPPRPPDPAPLPPGTTGGSIAGTQYRAALSAQIEWKFLSKIRVVFGTKP